MEQSPEADLGSTESYQDFHSNPSNDPLGHSLTPHKQYYNDSTGAQPNQEFNYHNHTLPRQNVKETNGQRTTSHDPYAVPTSSEPSMQEVCFTF